MAGNNGITVALSLHRAQRFIGACTQSLLSQTVRDFEVIMVEDPPFDRSQAIVDAFRDKRIMYVRNDAHRGISASRNRSVQLARGKFLFFTDADCIASSDWLRQGLSSLRASNCVGVEGMTCYVSEQYQPSLSDRIVENRNGGWFMTCNIAYRKSVVQRVGGFDEECSRMADRDLSLRVMKHGKIRFDPRMKVYHQRTTRGPMELVRSGRTTANRVRLFKKFGKKGLGGKSLRDSFVWRIVNPLHLLGIAVPLLIVGSLIGKRRETKQDLRLLPYVYLYLVYERFSLWRACVRERVFLI
jgi:GT2 family glycosyltransferase